VHRFPFEFHQRKRLERRNRQTPRSSMISLRHLPSAFLFAHRLSSSSQ
jgi:hypothetical protein